MRRRRSSPCSLALRHLDDNSLTSWAWVLEGRNLFGLWALHLAAICAALVLSRRALPDRWRLPAAVLAAFAAGVALAGEPEVVIDASRYFVQAKYLELFGPSAFFRDWGGALPAWTDLPLPAFLYGMIFRLCGEHRLPQQIFTAGLFALTAFATARIGGLLWGARTGARGALLLLAIPCLLVQVPLLMADVPAMAAVTAALWGLLETLERRGAWRVAAAALARRRRASRQVLDLGAARCGRRDHPAARGAAGSLGSGWSGRGRRRRGRARTGALRAR